MKTVAQRLEENYSWYLEHGYNTIEYDYKQLPMTFEDWVDYYYYQGINSRFAPKGTKWIASKLGSIQYDFELAFREHENILDITPEEEAIINAWFAEGDFEVYADAKLYIDSLIDNNFSRAASLMNIYAHHKTKVFLSYVRDLMISSI